MANLLGGTRIYGTVNVDTTILLGLYGVGSINGGLQINTTSVYVGNSTANATMNATAFAINNNVLTSNGYAALTYVSNTYVANVFASNNYATTAYVSNNYYTTGVSGISNSYATATLASNNYIRTANLSQTGTLTLTNANLIFSGIGIIIANSVGGTAGQILTANSTNGMYWATASSGGFSNGQSITTGNLVVNSTSSSSNLTSMAITSYGGIGANGNIYTNGRVGFANSSNISVVYQTYNIATGTLDTVFG